MAPLWFVAGLAAFAGAQPPSLEQIQNRLAEEAAVFLHIAPQTFAEETLQQRAVKPRPRFRLRIGDDALTPLPPRYQTREIVSEYSYSSFKASPTFLHEFRQVFSIDGQQVLAQEKARQSLSLGMRSQDDRLKKRMLEQFEKHGLIGTVTDFGQLILLFVKRRLPEYEFRIVGETRLGADPVIKVAYRQVKGAQALTIFEGSKAIHQPLQGEIWVRKPDLAPLRITLESAREEKDQPVLRDQASVDYLMSQHGVMLPVAVVHRQFNGELLTAENIFRYSSFRKFSAASEIKFTEVPVEPPK
jgi:hypothetical protein